MKIFEYSGPDSSSDNGNWVVLIRARTRNQADLVFHVYIGEMNRLDLAESVDIEEYEDTALIYSSVEKRD